MEWWSDGRLKLSITLNRPVRLNSECGRITDNVPGVTGQEPSEWQLVKRSVGLPNTPTLHHSVV